MFHFSIEFIRIFTWWIFFCHYRRFFFWRSAMWMHFFQFGACFVILTWCFVVCFVKIFVVWIIFLIRIAGLLYIYFNVLRLCPTVIFFFFIMVTLFLLIFIIIAPFLFLMILTILFIFFIFVLWFIFIFFLFLFFVLRNSVVFFFFSAEVKWFTFWTLFFWVVIGVIWVVVVWRHVDDFLLESGHYLRYLFVAVYWWT